MIKYSAFPGFILLLSKKVASFLESTLHHAEAGKRNSSLAGQDDRLG